MNLIKEFKDGAWKEKIPIGKFRNIKTTWRNLPKKKKIFFSLFLQ